MLLLLETSALAPLARNAAFWGSLVENKGQIYCKKLVIASLFIVKVEVGELNT